MTEHTTASTTADRAPERLEIRGAEVTIHTASERVTVTEHTVPAGFPGPPLHVHPAFDEVFVVIAGTIGLRVGDAVREVDAGGIAYAAGAVPHTFANAGDGPLRFLTVIAPGGFEGYFRALAAGDDAAVAELSARYGYAPA